MKTPSFLKKVVPIIFIACMPMLAMSQDYPTSEEPGSPIEPVPIDDGLPFLIAAGIGFGIYKAYGAQQKTLMLKQKQAIS